MGLKDVQDAVREHYHELAEGQRRVIDHLLADKRYAAVVSATELAHAANVSEATVTRAAQALGFAGYPDLQSHLRGQFVEVIHEKMINTADLGDTPATAAFRVMQEDVASVRTTMEDLSEDIIQSATSMLANARRVYIAGMRGSYGLAVMLGIGLRLLLPDARVLDQSAGDLADQLVSIGPEDVLVAISFRRLDQPIVTLAGHAARVGAKSIVITDHLSSPLARVADLILIARVGPLRPWLSYASAASLVSALIAAVSLQNLGNSASHLQVAEQLWEELNTYTEK